MKLHGAYAGVTASSEESHSIPRICFHHHDELKLVFEGSTAAGSANEILEQVAVDLPESSGLGHLCQVIDAELKAELFQVLNDRRKKKQTIKVCFILSTCCCPVNTEACISRIRKFEQINSI